MKDTPNPIAIRSKKMITDTLFELLIFLSIPGIFIKRPDNKAPY